MGNAYLTKNRFCPTQISSPPDPELGIVIVIPCYDEPALIRSLQSIWNSQRPRCAVEVITVINAAEDDLEAKAQNEKTFREAADWIDRHRNETLRFHLICNNGLPARHAGVGLARKIGMDEAVERFEASGHRDGIIVCFDADALCDPDYLVAIEDHFRDHPESPACSIYFEHPTKGDEFPPRVYNGIIRYELFLRYYRQGLRFAGFPYAYHTIGSSMAVRSAAYQKQGGMNRRKAGEDFYFLQKLIPLGNFTEISNTRVIPSPRPSDRVPFGTGKAIGDWLSSDNDRFLTYDPRTFIDLRSFCTVIPALYELNTGDLADRLALVPPSIAEFLSENNFEQRWLEIRKNSTSGSAFVKRFYGWFNAFTALKYVHFARDRFFGEQEIGEAAKQLLRLSGKKAANNIDDLLILYRELDRESRKSPPDSGGP